MSGEVWGPTQAQLTVAPSPARQATETHSIPREMHFEVDAATHTAVAAVSGDVSAAALADLGALLRNSLADGCVDLILDLTECSDFPTHGAGLLNGLADEARASGGQLTLHGVREFDAMMLRADGLADAIRLEHRPYLLRPCASTVGLGATACTSWMHSGQVEVP